MSKSVIPVSKRPKFVNVLRDVNSIRHRLGKKNINKLPKGNIGHNSSCVLANAIGCDLTELIWVTGIDLTKRLDKFIGNFDEGKYPWLIAS